VRRVTTGDSDDVVRQLVEDGRCVISFPNPKRRDQVWKVTTAERSEDGAGEPRKRAGRTDLSIDQVPSLC